MKVLVRFRRCWHVVLNGDEGIQGHSTATEKLADQEVRRLMWEAAKGYMKVGSRFEYLFGQPEIRERLRAVINYGTYDDLQAHWYSLGGGRLVGGLPQIYYDDSRVILARVPLKRYLVRDHKRRPKFSADTKAECYRYMKGNRYSGDFIVDTKKAL